MWLDGCSGCHMSLLDLDEGLSDDRREGASLVYSPLVDAREYPHDVDVAIVEGAVSTEEDLEKIRLGPRAHAHPGGSRRLCDHHSNISGMRNPIPLKTLFERIYIEGSDVEKGIPTDGLPTLLKHAVPLHDVVKIDLHVPGCPPSAPDDPVRPHRASRWAHSRSAGPGRFG